MLVPLLAACAHPDFPSCESDAAPGPVAWVVDHGWHTEIGIPATQATGPLAYYRSVFPGAETLMFGFGKQGFITIRAPGAADFAAGTIPGPGAVQVTALRGPPGAAYPGRTIRLALPPGGAERLAAFLWKSAEPTPAGRPRLVAEGLFAGSAFYASARDYTLLYTCNTWTADGLQQAGFPIGRDVVFAIGTMQEVARITGACSSRL